MLAREVTCLTAGSFSKLPLMLARSIWEAKRSSWTLIPNDASSTVAIVQKPRDSCWTGGVCCFRRARAALDSHLSPASVGLWLSEQMLTPCLSRSSGRSAAPPAAC